MTLSPTYHTVVLGAGESGVGAAMLCKKLGISVWVSDSGTIKDKYKTKLSEGNISFEEATHTEEIILSAAQIIKSPGIPEKAPILKAIRDKQIPVISEIEFAARYCEGKIVAITGTNGKSTATSLTYHLLHSAGMDVAIGGNIGKSFAAIVAERTYQTYVLEVSSFQLDDTFTFKPDVAVLLNITPDHLDRYHYNFEEYAAAKFKIASNQSEHDFFIFCDDDIGVKTFLPQYPIRAQKLPFSISHTVGMSAYVNQDQLYINYKNPFIMSISELALRGKHNIYNSLAAGIAARLFDIKKENLRESLSNFVGLEHRLEHVSLINGVEYINDSKATNVNSTWYALESMSKPVIWIVGGVDKGNDYDALVPLARKKVKAIVCLGIDNLKIHQAFTKHVDVIVNTKSAREAVRMASSLAVKGDAVLLSPACASFDLFDNYEDRGNQFKEAVRNL